MAASEKPRPEQPLCFVIGPIGSAKTPQRNHADLLLGLLIKEILGSDEFGYLVRRVDEDPKPGMITDRIVQDLISAKLVVADLTDLNPNAFYELGIRHATGKPTIHVAKAGTRLPFDNAGYYTIFVDLTDLKSITDARRDLATLARAIKSPDYKVSNPITQANASFKMRQSEDPRDRLVAELLERLRSLEVGFHRITSDTPSAITHGDQISLLRWEATRMKYMGSSTDEIERHLKGVAVGIGIELQSLCVEHNTLSIRTSLGLVDVPY